MNTPEATQEDPKCRMCGTIWLINPETGCCVTCEMEHFLDEEEEDEPMFLYVDEYAYAEEYGEDWRDVEAIGNAEEFYLHGDWLPHTEK